MIPPSVVRKLPMYVQAAPTRFLITDRNEVLRTPTNDLPAELTIDRRALAEITRRAHGEQQQQQQQGEGGVGGMTAMQHLQQTMAMSPLGLQAPAPL